MIDYKTILLNKGFYEVRGCTCGGVRNDKFKKQEVTIYVKPRQEKFRIKRQNTYQTPFLPLNLLDETLAAEIVRVN